jgi:voltage-gated potassium channel Kch
VFHQVEGWSYLDSFYFSAISAATVGYGDFTPKTPAGKLLTVFFVFSGIGLLVALLTRFADALIQSAREDQERLHLALTQAGEKIAHGVEGVAPAKSAEPTSAEEANLS